MRWRCSLCSVHTCVHALLSVEEFVQRRKKMTDRFSFHSFHKFKYRFFMVFLVVAFCRVKRVCVKWKWESERQVPKWNEFHGGTHCQRKFMFVIHHYFFLCIHLWCEIRLCFPHLLMLFSHSFIHLRDFSIFFLYSFALIPFRSFWLFLIHLDERDTHFLSPFLHYLCISFSSHPPMKFRCQKCVSFL